MAQRESPPTSTDGRSAAGVGAAAAPQGQAGAPNDGGGEIKLPSIATPKGGGALRSIGETFRANAVTGTGSLSIPLPLSPSRAGGTPRLALSYDSGRGQGPFGLGWDVDIPSIQRRTDKGLPQYRDADESDEFVLSGAEVLVPALVPDGTGWRRDEFDDGDDHVQRYRPRVEGGFARIEKRTDRTTGDVHWRTLARDNTLSIFGHSPGARLCDPAQPKRVFAWHLEATVDDRGNAVWFQYKAEDTVGVPGDRPEEKTRLADPQSFANLHVKRIHYGNRTAPKDEVPAASQLAGLGWMFEVVFDYGEHDQAAPTPDEAPDRRWAVRSDPFSSFRATFEMRTYRLCQRVLMFHRFDELGPAPVLVRSLGLAHPPSPVATTLASVTEVGWMPKPGGGYTTAEMPRLDLAYTTADLQTAVQTLDPASAAHVPGGVDGARQRWIDLDGEGIPGVLSQQGGALYYARNHGEGLLVSPVALRTKPSLARLQGSSQMLTSLDGDGRLDLVLLSADVRGFFERVPAPEADESGWSPFRSFARVPNIDPANPNLRFVDLDGDGLADMLVSEDEVFLWSRSLGKDGFDRPQLVHKSSDEAEGPRAVFADATLSIFLADMSGDGLVDVVRVRNGEVCYWPNLGYGRFGAKITMGNAPAFDRPEAFDPRRLRFGDVDGSGTSDIAYVRPDGVALYLNQAGNRWSAATVVAGVPGRPGTSIDLVDLLGTGTACLVWSSPEFADSRLPVRFVDLLGGTKPHLLNQITNNLGAETRVAFASSTSFYLADRSAGTPWVTRLPFPVQVVARVETADHVQKTRLVSTYRYAHGFFDGVEREFRGFGRVEHVDAEFVSSAHGAGLFPPGMNEADAEFVLPPVRTVAWFDTGAWREARDLYDQFRSEWYAGDAAAPPLGAPILPDEASADEARQAARARKGSPLRQEVYADDGSALAVHPYAVEEHRFEIVRLQPQQDQRHAVFFTHERESVARHYERNPDDPRVEHSFTLEVDDFGNVRRAAHVAYPRRLPKETEQGLLLATCTEADVVNETARFYRLGVPIETRVFELSGLTAPAGGLLSLGDVDAAAKTSVGKRLFGQQRTLYFKDGLAGSLPRGAVDRRALVFQSYAKALTADLVTAAYGGKITTADLTGQGGYLDLDGDGNLWTPSGRPKYDPTRFYLATALTDPFGNTASIDLDNNALLPTTMHSSDDATLDSVVTAANDYRVLHPRLITDPNGNQTEVAFDALGMLVATAVMGKAGGGEGDTIGQPTAHVEYDLLAWQKNGTPVFVHTFEREEHQVATTRILEAVTYSDGSGHEVLRKAQAESDPDTGAPRWVGTGRTVFDNKGNPVKKYEPYFSPTSAFEDEPAIVKQGVTAVLRYDPLGRLVQTDYPNGTFETVTFDAWTESHADASDNVKQSAWYTERTKVGTTASPAEQRAASLAAAHDGTPSVRTVDPLGRPFLVVEDNGAGGKYTTRTHLDIQGNPLTVKDARGIVAQTQVFDMQQRVLSSSSPDAGRRLVLHDVAGTMPLAFDARGVKVRTIYDRLRWPTQVFAQVPGTTEILAERLIYGEVAADGGAGANVRGRLVLHYDGAGEQAQVSFDFKGNPLTGTRRLATAVQTTPDWSALTTTGDVAAIQAAALAAKLVEAESFEMSTTYDALNRPTSITRKPDVGKTFPIYNQARLLERVEVLLPGAAARTPFVRNINYNAKGQRVRAEEGDPADGAVTTYEYDPLTFLLARQTAVGGDGRKRQDFAPTYDPVHNIVQISDDADQTLYLDGKTQAKGGSLYEYDAVYRLTFASGREHPGQQMPTDADAPFGGLPHPNDTQGLRAYTETHEYDAVGNILTTKHLGTNGWTRRYDIAPDSNRLVSTGAPGDPNPGAYRHDDSGNMTKMPHLATMVWDHANRLQQVDLGGGGFAYYTYDASGTRARKVVQRGNGSSVEQIYLGGFEIFRERTVAGGDVQEERQTLHVMDDRRRVALVETKTITGGKAVGQLIVRQRFQLDNHLHSSLVEVDEHGTVLTYEEYYPFGATSFHSPDGAVDGSAKRYRYTGKERDDETGLYYHGARYYAAWLGRWTAADPAGMVDGPNLYVYSRNSPLSLSDPSGQWSWGQVAGIAAGVVVGVAITALTGGIAGPIAAGLIAGAVSGAVSEVVEAAVDGRPITARNVITAAATGMVLGGALAGAGQLIARTQIGKAVVARIATSSVGQAVARSAYRIATSPSRAAGALRTAATVTREGIRRLEKTGEAVGRKLGGTFAANAGAQAERRAALEAARADAGAHAGKAGVQATIQGSIDGEPFYGTTRSGVDASGTGIRAVETPSGRVRAPSPEQLNELLEPQSVAGPAGPAYARTADAEIKLAGHTLLNVAPSATGRLTIGASAPICPSCNANLWITRSLRPGVTIISGEPLPISGAAGAFGPNLNGNDSAPKDRAPAPLIEFRLHF